MDSAHKKSFVKIISTSLLLGLLASCGGGGGGGGGGDGDGDGDGGHLSFRLIIFVTLIFLPLSFCYNDFFL